MEICLLGKIIRDEDNKPVIIQKQVCQLPKTMMYVEMCMPVEESGFDGARDEEGNIVISETAMCRHWPNWVKFKTKRYKNMCVCDKCGVPTEAHESLSLNRQKALQKLKSTVKRMRDGRSKRELEQQMKKYEDEIMENGKLKYD